MKSKVERYSDQLGWSVRKHLCHREIFEILVVSDDIYSVLGPFEVVSPNFEAFEDGEQLLVMGVIVAPGVSEGAGMEGNGVDVTIWGDSGDNASQCVVGGVSFDEHGWVRRPARDVKACLRERNAESALLDQPQ